MSTVSILRVNAHFIANRVEISCSIDVESPMYVDESCQCGNIHNKVI